MNALPVRLLLAAAAVAVLVLALTRTAAVDGCVDANRQVQRVATGRAVPGGDPGLVRRLQDHCRGAEDLAYASLFLSAAKTGDHAAAATTLARAAVRREPDAFLAYDALATALRSADPAAARRAVRRAQQLNPRGRAVRVP